MTATQAQPISWVNGFTRAIDSGTVYISTWQPVLDYAPKTFDFPHSVLIDIPARDMVPYQGTPLASVYVTLGLLDVLERISELKHLPTSWPGERPNATAIHLAKVLSASLDEHGLSAGRVSASVEGGVALSFYGVGRMAGLEVGNDGSITALTSDGAGSISAWDVDVEQLSITADRIGEHLGA